MPPTPPPERGQPLIDRLAADRHRTALEPPTPYLAPAPAGWRCEDFIGVPALDGFYPVAEAARMMERTEEEVRDMAARFLLAHTVVGRTIYVKPAITD